MDIYVTPFHNQQKLNKSSKLQDKKISNKGIAHKYCQTPIAQELDREPQNNCLVHCSITRRLITGKKKKGRAAYIYSTSESGIS